MHSIVAAASARTGARVAGRRARVWHPRAARVPRRVPLQTARARTPDARGLALACRLRLRLGDTSPPMRAARSQPSFLIDARAQFVSTVVYQLPCLLLGGSRFLFSHLQYTYTILLILSRSCTACVQRIP